MAKSLIDKLKNIKRNLRSIILSVVAGAFLYGAQCVPNPPPKPKPEPENNPPIANMYVFPVYGQAPLPVSIKLDGDDKDGIEDIVEYEVFIDREGTLNDETIWQLNPINITRDFYESAAVEGKVTDSAGATDKKTVAVNVYQPGNNPPQIISTPKTEVNEGEQYYYDVDAIDDDGDILTYYLVKAPGWLSIDSSTGVIVGVPEKVIADEKPDVVVGASDGKDSTLQEYILTVYNLLNISGQIKNNKTELKQKGKVKIFDSVDEVNPIEIVDTDPNGNFNFNSTTKRSSELSGISLKAVLTNNGNPISYAHTLRYLAEDLIDVVLKPHPNPTFASRENYREHILMTNYYSGLASGLKKWDLEGKVAPENALKGIGIFTTNPLQNNDSYFSPEQINVIKNKIKDSNDIEVLVRGSNLPDTDPTDGDDFSDLDNFILDGEPIEGTHYEIFGSSIAPKPGYILVTPDGPPSLPDEYDGITDVYYSGGLAAGIINGAVIRIKYNIYDVPLQKAVSHEFKHAFTNPYDYRTPYSEYPPPLSSDLTILHYETSNTTAGEGEADIEDAYVMNEELYKHGANSNDFLGDW